MKKISKLLIVATLLMSILFSFGCNKMNLPVNETLLNGGFEQVEEDGTPSSWYTSLGSSDSTVSVSNTGIGGSSVIKINSNGGWSYACQSIKVEKDTWYKVSADIRIVEAIAKDSSATETIGAYVGFLENTSIILNNKQSVNSWSAPSATKYVIYINSESLTKLTITLNIGADGKGASGIVEFDNISVTVIDDTAIESVNEGLCKYITKGMNSFDGFNEKYSGIVVAIAGIIALAVIILLYIQLRKHNNDSNIANNSKSIFANKYLLLIFAVALITRVLVGLYSSGTNLISTGKNWNTILDSGFTSYYGQYGANGGLPIAVYINYLFGKLSTLLGISSVIIYKLPSIICDAVATIFVYKLAKKFANESKSLIFAGIYALLPATILLSSVWNMMSGVVALLLIMTLYYVVDKKFVPMAITFVLALLTDKTAIYALPVLLVYLIYVLVKQPKYRKTIICILVASVLGMALAFLPLVFSMLSSEPLIMFYQYFKIIFGSTSKYTVAMPNLYTLFNLSAITVSSTSYIFNIVLLVLMGVFTVFVYFKNKNRKDILMLVAYAYCALSVFAVGADMNNMLMMLALAMVYLVVSQDRRIYYVLGAYGLLASIDSTYLVAKTGILGDSINCVSITSDYLGAFHYVVAALIVLVTFYFTYLVYDITIEKENKLIRSL